MYVFNPGLIFIFISTLLASNPFQSRPWCRCDFSSQAQGVSKSNGHMKYYAAEIFQCSNILNSIHTSQPLPLWIHQVPSIKFPWFFPLQAIHSIQNDDNKIWVSNSNCEAVISPFRSFLAKVSWQFEWRNHGCCFWTRMTLFLVYIPQFLSHLILLMFH